MLRAFLQPHSKEQKWINLVNFLWRVGFYCCLMNRKLLNCSPICLATLMVSWALKKSKNIQKLLSVFLLWLNTFLSNRVIASHGEFIALYRYREKVSRQRDEIKNNARENYQFLVTFSISIWTDLCSLKVKAPNLDLSLARPLVAQIRLAYD